MPPCKLSDERCIGRLEAGFQRMLGGLERQFGTGKLRILIHLQRFPRILLQWPLGRQRFFITAGPIRHHKPLSPRELEAVLCLLGELPRKSVALELGVSELTAQTFIKRAYDKLGISTHEELIKVAAAIPQEQPGMMSSEEKEALLLDIRTRLDHALGNLVVRLARDLGESDLGLLFVGMTTPLVLADIKHEDCRYVLRAMAEATLPELTLREREITPLLACGLPREAIAQVLHISRETVKAHARWIFSKYHVHFWSDLAGRLIADCLAAMGRTLGGIRSAPLGTVRN